MVVKEKRIVFTIEDIRLVRLQCNNCQGEVGCRLSSEYQLPVFCPHCSERWTIKQNDAQRLISTLNMLLRNNGDVMPYNISFEIEEADNSSRG